MARLSASGGVLLLLLIAMVSISAESHVPRGQLRDGETANGTEVQPNQADEASWIPTTMRGIFPLWPSHTDVQYRSSRMGRDMVSGESTPAFLPRGLMSVLALVQGSAVAIWLLMTWNQAGGSSIARRSLSETSSTASAAAAAVCQSPRSLLVLSLLNVLLHTGHYADNIFLPAKYCEPRWLYSAYVVTEMELTFGFFTPLMWLAILVAITVHSLPRITPAALGLLSAGNAQGLRVKTERLVRQCFLYLLASGLSGLHYVVEPPRSYTFQANVTIAGSVVAAMALMIDAIRCHRMVSKACDAHTGVGYSTIGLSSPTSAAAQ